MRLRFTGDDDERQFLATREALLDEFAGWFAANRPADDGEALADAGTFLDWRYKYSTGVLDEYDEGDLTEFLLEWCPRKLSMPAEDSVRICAAIGTFIEFLTRTDRLVGGAASAARLITVAQDLIPETRAAMSDPSKYGMAKSMFTSSFGGLGAIDDVDSIEDLQDVLDARMEAFNALPFDQRKALTDRFFAPQPELVELPFVHIPPPRADVESAANAAPLLAKIDALRDYLGVHGKSLTGRGNLKLADGRALIALLDTGDVMDETIGDRTFKTRSTEQLTRLRQIVDIAKEAGAVRLVRDRLVPVKAWGRRTALERATAGFQAVLRLGPLWSSHRRSVPLYDQLDQLLDDGIPHWLAGLLAPGEIRPIEEIADLAKEVVRLEIAPYYDFSEEVMEGWAARDVCRIFDLLAVTGVVEWCDRRAVTEYGRTRYEAGVVELTALGRHLVPDLLPAAGYRLRSIGDLSTASAAELIEAIDFVPSEELESIVAAWRSDWPESQRADQLVAAIANAGDGRARLGGLAAIELLDPEATAPYVRQLLDSPAAGHAALWLIAHGLADEATVARFVNVGTFVDVLSSSLDDPGELCELFMSSPDASQPEEMLGRIWRHDAPETAAVLDVLGHHLPDRKLAKAARKAAIQHRTWMANRR